MRIALLVIGVLVAGSATTVVTGVWFWKRATAARIAQLTEAIVEPEQRCASAARAVVPLPVARYFRRVLKDGQLMIRSVIATQQAEFFINGEWRPLKATQHFSATPPGLVWDATITMAPLLQAYVRDAYVDGRGSMQATIYGLWPLVNQAGTAELTSGALQRFLGEAVWLPTALLPSPAISWTGRDDHSAVVTLTDQGTRVSLLFEFDDHGDVMRISGDRYKESAGADTLQPWIITCREHVERSGIRYPSTARWHGWDRTVLSRIGAAASQRLITNSGRGLSLCRNDESADLARRQSRQNEVRFWSCVTRCLPRPSECWPSPPPHS